MAITKVTSGLISADASSIDLNIDAGTLYLDVSENRVGIGTTSPATQFHIVNADDAVARIESNGSESGDDARLEIKTTNGTFTIQNDRSLGTSGALTFAGNTSNNLVIDHNSGNVGIGTNSPSSPLTISKAGDLYIQVNNSSAGFNTYLGTFTNESRIVCDGAKPIAFFVNGSRVVDFANGGNVGIGLTNPSAALETFGGTSFVGAKFKGYSGGKTALVGGDLNTVWFGDDDGSIGTTNNFNIRGASNSAKIVTNSVARLEVDGSGNVLVGTTSVAPATQDGFVLYPQGTLHVTRADDYVLYLNRRGSDGVLARMVNDGVVVGGINVSGSSTSYNTSSDYRLKENVDYDFTALDRVSQLKPARFNFIADETNTLVDGFLAHEVSSIVPEAVAGEKDAVDDEGNPEYQGIDQSKLVPLLTKAIQEQQTIIDNLKTRIETLESA